MNPAASFLAGTTPAASPLPGAEGSRAASRGRGPGTTSDGATFAAALVGALLQGAPAEVRAALLNPGRGPGQALAESGDETAPEGEASSSAAGAARGGTPSIAELLARVDAHAAASADGPEAGADMRRLLDGVPAEARRALGEALGVPGDDAVDTRRILAGMGLAPRPAGPVGGEGAPAPEASSPAQPATVAAGASGTIGAGPAPATDAVASLGAGSAFSSVSATAERGVGASASPAAPNRDASRLDPTLRHRFERVQERMADEFGHRVEIAEGHRTGARQDHLYAQGRSRPGPVVTWTRHSQHETGRALDVMIDGGWDDPAAFQRLQRIAVEEGLATLGPRDPGHLELPGEGGLPSRADLTAEARSDRVAEAQTPRRVRFTGPARAAHVADPARVAAVARPGAGFGRTAPLPASTAGPMSAPDLSGTTPDFAGVRDQVAQAPTPGTPGTSSPGAQAPEGTAASAGPLPAPRPVASPPSAAPDGGSAASHRSTGPEAATSAPGASPPAHPNAEAAAAAAPTPTPVPSGPADGRATASAQAPAPSAAASGSNDDAAPRDGDRRSSRDDARVVAETTSRPTAREPLVAEGTRAARFDAPAPTPTAEVARPDVAGRAERVAELQEQALHLKGDRVSLRVEHPDGEVTRIRMGTGQRRVDAELRTGDPVHARRLRQDVSELSARLEEKGLKLGDVAIRDARPGARGEGTTSHSGLDGALRQSLQSTSESSDAGAQGRDAQQRQQQQRQEQDAWSGRHRPSREDFDSRDDTRHRTPWETWKEDLR